MEELADSFQTQLDLGRVIYGPPTASQVESVTDPLPASPPGGYQPPPPEWGQPFPPLLPPPSPTVTIASPGSQPTQLPPSTEPLLAQLRIRVPGTTTAPPSPPHSPSHPTMEQVAEELVARIMEPATLAPVEEDVIVIESTPPAS